MKPDLENYGRNFPSALWELDNRIYGCWIIGNNYKRKTGYYGEYPPSYIKRVYSLFPKAQNVLHLFSGAVQEQKCTTIDINPELCPDIVGDAHDLSGITSGLQPFDLVMADPPYSSEDAAKYGVKMINRRRVINEVREVVSKDSYLVWLDLLVPIFSKNQWRLAGLITLFCGTNRRVRTITLFQGV